MNTLTIKKIFTKKYSTFLIFPIEAIINILSSFFSFYILIYIITLPLTYDLGKDDIGAIIFLIVILRPFLSVVNNISLFMLIKKQAYILSMFSNCFTSKKDIQQNEHDVVNYSEYDTSLILIISKIICFLYLSVLMITNIEEGVISLVSLLLILLPLSFFLFKKRIYLSKKLAKARKLRYRFIGSNLESLTSIFLTGYKGGKISNLNKIFNTEEKIKIVDSLWRAIDISSNAFIKIIPVILIMLVGKEVDNNNILIILLYSLILVSEYLGVIRLLTPFFDGYLAKNSIVDRYKNHVTSSKVNFNLDGEQGAIGKTILENIYISKELIHRDVFNKLVYDIFHLNEYLDMRAHINNLSRGQLSLVFSIRNIYTAIINNYKGCIYFNIEKTGWDSSTLVYFEHMISKIKHEYEIDILLSCSHVRENKNIEFNDKSKEKKSFFFDEDKKETEGLMICKFINIFKYNSFFGIILLLISSLSLFELGRITYIEYNNEIFNILLTSFFGMACFIMGAFLIEFKIRKKARIDIYNSIEKNLSKEGFNLFKHEYNVIINKFTMYAKDVFWFGAIFVGAIFLSIRSGSFIIILGVMFLFVASILLLYAPYKKNRTKHYEMLHSLTMSFSYIKKLPQCNSVSKFCQDTITYGIHNLYTIASQRYLITSLASILGLIVSSLVIFYSLYPNFEPDNITAAINLDNRIVIFYFAIFGYLSETTSIQRITEYNYISHGKNLHHYKLSNLEKKLDEERIIQLVGSNGSGKTLFLRGFSAANEYIYIDHGVDRKLINDKFLDYLNNSSSNVIIFDEFDCKNLINKIDKNKKIIIVSHMECFGSKFDISEVR
ncbi:hypothetical protein [Photorhabdus bodei]|uniref:ABC transmembrane type-1 domain-containing protein n=1 Tax=Photorhabdus bodei TaxID=2029681 RepID=A0ABX0ASF8_9GAMM|nr:hypothetical protein [Photorhabdus bodei]NDL01596.1 hypothetical protein [Photorhabdus bodei]NDL05853.1 hypothetical protein [Photorhabdus bodei]NDL10107.1 hypothetical protein [Photorhabdus bodei]